MFRQALINRAIDGGVDVSDLAEVMGTSVGVLAKHYKRRRSHSAYSKFIDALEKAD